MPVVKETRLVFDTDEILAVRIRCHAKECDGETLFYPKKHKRPTQCAVCGAEWRKSDQNQGRILELLDCLKALQDPTLTWSLTLFFEIDGEHEKKASV